eukprot:m.53235 g.53235  ORF g.53235 m.53235 type:complete len:291 (-) comp9146_c0_seq3:783-1655(-)
MNPKRLCARVRRDCGVVLSPQFGKEALEEAARSRLSGDSALVDFVLQRWLDTDMAVTSPVAVLPGKEETVRLDHAVVVQVDAVVDVSRGAYDQLVECRRMRDRSEQWERSKHGGAAVESSKRVLKLKLTDGINAVIGFEVETIPWLRKHTMPGSKIRLLPGTEIKEGLVLLNPRLCEDVKQRAASPEEEARHYENLLKRLLGWAAHPLEIKPDLVLSLDAVRPPTQPLTDVPFVCAESTLTTMRKSMKGRPWPLTLHHSRITHGLTMTAEMTLTILCWQGSTWTLLPTQQ